MKKRKRGKILSRKKGARRALVLSLARALCEKERIQTTLAKAKEAAPFVERLVTKAKEDSVRARRELALHLDEKGVRKMIREIGPRYRERRGGYTRITKLEPRSSDGAQMAFLEFVQ